MEETTMAILPRLGSGLLVLLLHLLTTWFYWHSGPPLLYGRDAIS